MNELFTILFFIAIFFTAKSSSANEFVSGYCRSDGTCVNGYWRSSPDPTVQDNFSYHGNINPYTGQVGTNYYRNNPSSQYYGTSQYQNFSNPTIIPNQPYGWQEASQNIEIAIRNNAKYACFAYCAHQGYSEQYCIDACIK